ncbi:MAG: SIS domain-containing protein [Brevinema sp.]
MTTVKKYFKFALDKIEQVEQTQSSNIKKSIEAIVNSCNSGGSFYVFGSGHSHMVAEEIYIRAGGLALVKAILPPELMLHEMPNKSTYLERLNGYSQALLKLYQVSKGDVLMVVSNSGRNNVPVEMCLEAKKMGVFVIALTSIKHSQSSDSRHISGKKMYEIADITIDNRADKGDASFYIEGFDIPVGATSDITGLVIAQAIITGIVSKMVEQGKNPPVFKSSNLDGADEYNEKLFDRYYRSL